MKPGNDMKDQTTKLEKKGTNMKSKHIRSVKPLTPEHFARVLAAAEGEMHGLVLAAMTTGQRIGDIVSLKRGDVDLSKGLICFSLAKTGRELVLPIDPRLRRWLEEQMRRSAGVLLFPGLAGKGLLPVAWRLQEVGRKAGVEVNALTFRHALAQALMEQGLPLKKVKRRLG
jgi:integrase